MLAAAMLLPFASQAQTTVSIGDASSTTTNYSLPVNMYYNYSLTQQIFTADEIGMAGTISAISFEYTNTSAFTMDNVQLYMMNVSKDNFTSTTDMVSISAADLVWQGTFTAQQDGWITITLTTPFSYNGVDNLLICMYDSINGYPGNAYKFRCTSTATDYPGEYLAMAYYSDSYVPNLSDVSTFSGSKSRYNYRDNIQLTITPSGSSICAKPAFLHALDITAHEATLSWASTTAGNYQIEYKMASDSVWTTAVVADTSYDLSLLQSNTAYDARVKAICGVDNESGYRNASFSTLISCPAPTGLAAVLTPGDGSVATLNWTENGTATTWELLYSTDADFTGVSPITVTGTPTYSLTGLTAETTLYAKVRAICDVDDESTWTSTISFTPTDAYSLTVNDGTTTNSYVPIYGMWVDNHTKSQFIIPATDLTGMVGSVINKLTFYCSASSINWGAAEFAVYMTGTTDNTISALVDETSMSLVRAQGSLSVSNNIMEVILTVPYYYAGGNLLIAFDQPVSGTYVSSSWYGVNATSGASWGGYGTSVSAKSFLPKITFDFAPSTGDICLPVMGLTASDITTDGATISWSGSANSYTIYDLTDTSVVATVTDTFYTFSNLNPMTAYAFGVVANCATSESIMMSTSFATACTAVTLPYTETFEATSGSIVCWTTDGPGNWTVGTGDNSSTTGAFEGSLNAKITHGSTGDATKLISPVLDNVTDGLKLDFAYVMRAWGSDIDELHVYSRADADSAWQQVAAYTDAAATWTVANVIIPGTVYQVAFEFVDGYGYGLGIDSVVFSEMTGDYCHAVSNLTAGNATANSIDLSWLDANNSGASYTVYNMADTSVVASNVSGNNYTVSGLNASTAYTFGVVANCSATSASDIVTVSAATGCVGSSCNIYVYAQDSYGDGWNGATINFLQNGVNVDSYSMAGQGVSNTVIYDTAAVSVCAGAPISLNWTSGSWDSEITVEIANSFGDVLFTASGSDLTGEFLVLDSCSAVATVDTTTGDVTITFAVNDATMGTTNPAPGTYTYNENEVFTITLIPNAGYRVVDLVVDLEGTTYHLGGITSWSDSAYSDYDGMVVTAIFGEDCPDSVAIPYIETFDNGTGCWTTVNTHSNTGVITNPVYVYSGTGAFVFSYNTNPPQYFITPRLAGTGNGVKVEFYYSVMMPSYPESFQIGYSTTTNDTSAFVWGVEQTNLTNTTYAHYSEIIGVPGVKYVSIRYTANDMYYLFVDELSVSEAPSCLPVTNLTLTTSTTNSVTLSWTDAGNTGASYTVYNMADTSVVATGITTTSYTVANLATATNYTFGVAANCSATETSAMATINVTTECDIISTFPYTQDFSAVPICWTMIDGDGDGYCWQLISGGIHSASYENYVGALTPDNWLITPHFQLAANTNYEVTWNADPQDASWPAEHYGLYVSTTSNTDTNAFTLVQEWTLTSAGHVPVVNLSSYAGQNVYLAFRHWNCTDMFRIAIDNFELREAAGANQITVTLTQNNPMYGSVSGSGVYTIGDNVTVSATPAEDYQFSRWMDAAGSVVSTANPYTFVAATDITLQAVFISTSADSLTITADVNDSTMGYTTGSGEYLAGDAAVLTAYAYDGYHFVNWTSNGIDLGSANPLTITVTSNSAMYPIVANFVPAADPGYLTLTTAVNDPAMGTMTPAPGTYRYGVGDTVTFAALPNEGYRYAGAHVTVSMMGIPMFDTTVNLSLDYLTLVVEPEMLGTEVSVTVNFEEGDPIVEEYMTLVTAVNDPSMGSITPAPGTYQYAIGEDIHFSATPNDGYHMENANVSVSYMGMPLADTVFTDISDIDFTVDEMMVGFTVSVTINFARNNAIDVAGDLNNINVYPNPTHGKVTVDADDVVKVDVMDLYGRVVTTFENTNSFDISSIAAGTYMLRIETTSGTALKRIVKN